MLRPIAILLAATLTVPAQAQLIAEQNGIDAGALFEARGFTNVAIVRRGIDRVEAEACRAGERWRVSLKLLSGRAKLLDRLGPCGLSSDTSVAADPETGRAIQPPWSEEDAAMRALEAVGYTGVQLRKWGGEGWRGTACRDGRLREVRVSAQGRAAAPLRAIRPCPPGREIARDLTNGPPEPPIRSVRDVKARLIARGYAAIGRIEIEGGAFHALACEGDWRFRVTMLPDGTVRGRSNLGRCEATRPGAPVPAAIAD